MRKIFHRILAKSRSLRTRMDEYQESITFAEAGETNHGTATPAEPEQMIQEPGVLLVIGNEDTFSRRIIDYALEMAQRMSYRIVALNAAPVPEAALKLLSAANNKIQEFEQAARKNAAPFQQAAEKCNVPFEHIVKFGETDAIIQEVARDYGGIEFVVSEPAERQVSDRAANENRPEKQLYVYTMV